MTVTARDCGGFEQAIHHSFFGGLADRLKKRREAIVAQNGPLLDQFAARKGLAKTLVGRKREHIVAAAMCDGRADCAEAERPQE